MYETKIEMDDMDAISGEWNDETQIFVLNLLFFGIQDRIGWGAYCYG